MRSRTPAPLAPRARRRAMRLSVLEGLVFSLMVGAAEVYFVADAVRLGASPLEQALVTTLPLFIGGLGPLLGLHLLAARPRRKPLVVAGAVAQALVLAVVALGDALGASSGHTLITAVCLYQVFGQGGGTLWSSWYGDVVPGRIRGRYFSRRSRVVQIGTCVSLVATGLLLHGLEPRPPGVALAAEGGLGFAIAFGIGAVFRLISAVLLSLSPEPAHETGPRGDDWRALLREGDAHVSRRLLAVGFCLQLSVYLASPYFGPYMLNELRLSYGAYMVGSLAVVLVKIASLPSWGRVIDSHGPRAVFLLAVLLVALIPLPWLWTSTLLGVVVAQSLSGFAWGGHEIAQLAVVLDSAPPRLRPRVFAAQAVCNGLAQLAGSLLAGLVLAIVGGRYLVLFAVSTGARLCVAMLAPRLLRHVERPGQRSHELLLRVIGFRPSGGLVHRPIEVDEEPRRPDER